MTTAKDLTLDDPETVTPENIIEYIDYLNAQELEFRNKNLHVYLNLEVVKTLSHIACSEATSTSLKTLIDEKITTIVKSFKVSKGIEKE